MEFPTLSPSKEIEQLNLGISLHKCPMSRNASPTLVAQNRKTELSKQNPLKWIVIIFIILY